MADTTESFREKTLRETMYLEDTSSQIASIILGGANHKVNVKMAVYTLALDGLFSIQTPSLYARIKVELFTIEVVALNKIIDGWGIESAIKAETAKNLTPLPGETAKGKGIMGKLGGK
jgi:hypothetical protein